MDIRNTLQQVAGTSLLATSILFSPFSSAVSVYNQDFESLNAADAFGSLSNDGWFNLVSVFDTNDNFKFNYFVNWTIFGSIETGEGGLEQGLQYLSTTSDYNCCVPSDPEGHLNGTDHVETSLIRGQVVDNADIGSTWRLQFDAKLAAGSALGPDVSAAAFIRTIDYSGFGGILTNLVEVDTTLVSNSSWSTYSIDFTLNDPSLAGQLIEIGFTNTSENNQNAEVYYDNISFSQVPVPAAVWFFASALAGLLIIRRS